jgi:two-component system chemotaxis sensor kinase CheA
VQRTLRIADQVIRPVAGARMLVLDDAAIPVLAARDAFGHPGEAPAEDSHLVLVGAGDRAVALTVSRLVGQVELVTRPLPDEVGEGAAVSGAAVLADGDIVLLADCDAIARTAQGGRGLSTTTTRRAA